MKIKYIITLATILISLNVYSQSTPQTIEEALNKLDDQITAIQKNKFASKLYNIDEIILQVEKNRDNLPELIKISKQLEFDKAEIGTGSICVC
jgi:hypothetical protein